MRTPEERVRPPFDFSGKTALVTGGSRGIGAVVAAELARCGARVVVNYREDAAGAEATVRRIESEGGAASARRANLVHPDEIRDLFAGLDAPLDFLVHNAAIGSFKPMLDLRPNQWDLSLSVNARALLLCAQSALPLMEARDGAIVAMSSLGSARVVPEYGAIGASKAALESVVRSLAVELGPRGIRVNAVAGGVVDGPTIRKHPRADALLDRARTHSVRGRLVTAEELAAAVLFLCSAFSAGIAGQTIVVDGGSSLGV
jgi:enoyl-[acyl-carrier protein] reductase III